MYPYAFPFVSLPFKGQWYYEMQVGPIVFMWKHDLSRKPSESRLKVWRDSAWWQMAKPRCLRTARRGR